MSCPLCPRLCPIAACDCDTESDFELDDTASSSSVSTATTLCDCDCPSSHCPPYAPPSPTSSSTDDSNPGDFYDLVVIGGGPNALGLAARLNEEKPAALYTDLEHARLSWLRRGKSKYRKSIKGNRKLVEPPAQVIPNRRIKVIDAGGGWLNKWDNYFRNLRISHLRSPMFFHPSPHNDGLVSYSAESGRESELRVIDNVVGRERSKHSRKKHPNSFGRDALVNERNRSDYFSPSSSLFRSFCETELISRYSLDKNIVQQGNVTSLSYPSPSEGFRLEVIASDGTKSILASRAVVLAIGASSAPNVPEVIRAAGGAGEEEGEGWCHSSAFGRAEYRFPPRAIREAIKAKKVTSMLVIGGGLTSAQITSLAIERGVSRVILVCRGHLKVRHFDFGLEWVSKFANILKMAFYQEHDREERFELIKQARGGGSVNPTFNKILKQYAKSGRLDIKTNTTVDAAAYDPALRKWSIELLTTNPATLSESKEKLQVDYVVCSTGSAMAFDKIPFIQPLLASHPIEMIRGAPRLTEDLQWSAELPAFVMGSYSILELGADAGNLASTRVGSERIAYRLGQLDLVERDDIHELEESEGSYYAALNEVEL